MAPDLEFGQLALAPMPGRAALQIADAPAMDIDFLRESPRLENQNNDSAQDRQIQKLQRGVETHRTWSR